MRFKLLGCGENKQKCDIDWASEFTKDHKITVSRVRKMAKLRNIYLDYIFENMKTNDTDILLTWDMDAIGSIDLEGIYNSVGHLTSYNFGNISGVCSMGNKTTPFGSYYYDTAAHVSDDECVLERLFPKKLKDFKIRMDLKSYSIGSLPVRVKSCFGGFTLYNLKNIIDKRCRYDEECTVCEHIAFNECVDSVVMNPSMIYSVYNN